MSRKDLLPGAGPVLNTRQALYRATRDATGGQNAVALTIGMDPDELNKRVSPNNNRPIHPEFLEEIVAATRDPRLLAALVRPAGAVAYVPRPVPATRAALKELGKLLRLEGEFVESLHEGAADNRWLPHEVETLRYHANQVIGQVLGIVAGAELAMLEAVAEGEVTHG
ncbi:phage regulatory CII family protein [Stutzerimonas nitrititolerans]|uniref:phage regulatory CII family protein n=1 Tax=Stutzerimonas nitrititolerans TaxID=2482751 RepID=UPI002648BFF9|nr:phage regulatory CII family protein [Stutzerimonas nitrititolerans]